MVDFVLVGQWFFCGKGFFHVNPCVIYFSYFISLFLFIFCKGWSWGIFPTSGIRSGGSLAIKMSAMKFDVEKFDGRINFGLWQVHVKDILIQSGHIKKYCTKARASSKNCSNSQTNIVTFDDEIL